MLLVKKSLNRALNVFLFAVMGSIVGAAIGFAAGASVAALLLIFKWPAGAPPADFHGLAVVF